MKNKPVPVFYMGKPLKSIYPHATRWQVFKYRLNRAIGYMLYAAAGIALVTAIIASAFTFGQLNVQSVEVKIEEQTKHVPPVMQRICKAESGCKHLGPSGQVIVHVNGKGLGYDIGKYQINSIWNKKATELGFNLYKEEDNEAFAIWLYENLGTSPWESSSKNW